MSVVRLYTIIYISFLLISFFKIDSQAQNIKIIAKHPHPYQFKIEDLWNTTLINLSEPINIYLSSTIENSSAKVMIEVKTSNFNLPTGIKQVNSNIVVPVDIKEHSGNIKKTLTSTGILPSGSYRVCISAISSETNQKLSSTCNDYEILSLSRPELISPQNDEIIKDKLPEFSWNPPIPLPKGKNITYELTVVEIYKDQSVSQALQTNPKFIKKRNIISPIFQYTATEKKLEIGKKYAWIVKVFIDGCDISESEAWEFAYETETPSVFEYEESTENKLEKEFTYKEPVIIFKKDNWKNEYLYTCNSFKSTNRMCALNKDINTIYRTGSEKSFYHDIKLLIKTGKQSESSSAFELLNSYSVLNYQYSTRQMIGSEIPKNFVSLRFDPIFTIFELPLALNLYLDTKQSDDRQNINNYAMKLEPYLLRDIIAKKKRDNKGANGFLKFMSDFRVLKIGEIYPYYSDYTLNGSRITGIDIVYNPGFLYLAVTGLNNLKAIEDINYSRKLIAGKIGVGNKEDNHLHFTGMKAWDNENSLNPNQTTSGITPQENFLFGSDGKLNILDDKLIFEGEFVGSMYTRDKTSPMLESEKIPGFLSFILEPRISSSFDYMYLIRTIYENNESQTEITGEYKSIGPGYTSLGAQNIRNDIRNYKIKINQKFLDRKIQLTASMERERNNVGSLNPTTETTNNYSFNMKFNFKNLPYVILDYRPNYVYTDEEIDSLKIDYNSSVITFMTGFNDFTDNYYNSTNLLISTVNNNSSSDISNYKILNFLLSSNLSLAKVPLSFALSTGYTFNNSIENSRIVSFDFSCSYLFFEKMNNTLGFSYLDEKNRNKKYGAYFITSIPLGNIADFYLRAEQNFYREKVYEYGDNNEFILTATLSKNLNLR